MRARTALAIIGFVGLIGLTVLITSALISNSQPASIPASAAATSFPVTLFAPTEVAPSVPTPAAQPTSAPSVEDTPIPTVAIQPPPTARLSQYTVVERDTLWDIAMKFGLSVDEIIATNPGINPNLIIPGDVLNIPAPGTVDISKAVKQPTAALAASVQVVEPPSAAQVSATGGNLRLRKAPDSSAEIITKLPALTPLTVVGRTSDNFWLQVTLADGTGGWVMSQYVNWSGNTAGAVEGTSAPPISVKPGQVAPIPTDALPRKEPYLNGFTTRAREIYEAGLRMGNHSHVFTLVGDSNTANPAFIQAIDQDNYDLGEYGYLKDTIDYFKGSFNLSSVAAVGGFNTTRLYEPERASPAVCQPGEGSLVCEYRVKQPSVALILIGTNDRPIWQDFEENYRPIIEDTVSRGILPVLITKGDDMETNYGGPPDSINSVIRQLSQEYSVPLLDLKQAIGQFNLPNGGFEADGFHYNAPPDGLSAYFTGDHLKYGYTIRNLTALQALDAVRRLIIDDRS